MKQRAEEAVLVVGFGIAGALVSWFLKKHNIHYVVVDDSAPGSSSPVAAGLINPLAGRALMLDRDLGWFLPFSRQTFQQIGQFLGQKFWEDRDFITLLRNEGERQQWKARAMDPEVHPYLDANDLAEPGPAYASAEAGVVRVRGGGQVAFGPLLQAFAMHLEREERFIRQPFDHAAVERLQGTEPACWSYRGTAYRAILFCEGYRVRYNPWFAHLPWRVNRGQRIIVRIPGLMPPGNHPAVWRKQALLAPLGGDEYWLGSINDWDSEDPQPTREARETLLAQLERLTSRSGELVDISAGIRPVLKDRKPAVGFHAVHPTLGLLNGLGTKGALLGPWYASALVERLPAVLNPSDTARTEPLPLITNASLDEVSLTRFTR